MASPESLTFFCLRCTRFFVQKFTRLFTPRAGIFRLRPMWKRHYQEAANNCLQIWAGKWAENRLFERDGYK